MKNKKLIKKIALVIVFGLIAIFVIDTFFSVNASRRLYYDAKEIPKNRVGVVLGVGKFTSEGYVNLFYKYRLEAAVELFQVGKIDLVLVSGDNSRCDYDEPTTFKNDLMALGIPEDRIVLDYAGFRTLDSAVRAKKVFGLDNFTFISQRFHNERALFLADAHGINAIGYNAKDVTGKFGRKAKLREYLARPVAVLDVVFNTQPKYLGVAEKI